MPIYLLTVYCWYTQVRTTQSMLHAVQFLLSHPVLKGPPIQEQLEVCFSTRHKLVLFLQAKHLNLYHRF